MVYTNNVVRHVNADCTDPELLEDCCVTLAKLFLR